MCICVQLVVKCAVLTCCSTFVLVDTSLSFCTVKIELMFLVDSDKVYCWLETLVYIYMLKFVVVYEFLAYDLPS